MLVMSLMGLFAFIIAFIAVIVNSVSDASRLSNLDTVIKHASEFGVTYDKGYYVDNGHLYQNGKRVKYVWKDGVKYKL